MSGVATGGGPRLAEALEAQRERLMPCVHCGFCLPACPTYNRLGNEADSPRGRLYLMRAVVEGRLDAGSEAFRTHIDRCLGCRACEPVCPSGVEYGHLLELARDASTDAHPPDPLTRALLAVFGSPALRRLFFLAGRVMRGTGLAALGVRILPDVGVLTRARLGLSMLASTGRWRGLDDVGTSAAGSATSGSSAHGSSTSGSSTPASSAVPSATVEASAAASRGRAALLTGCVQAGLYDRVNAATARTLEANGFEVVTVKGQECCGALHAHGGDLDTARRLARVNVARFEAAGADVIVVNAAGCGAVMKEYDALLEHDPAWRDRAKAVASTVRDVTEVLADAGPRRGAPVPCTVAYDHPCHLLHAQRVESAPLDVLAAVPGAEVRVVENAAECCGGAGIYGLTHPELGGRIGADKVAAVRRTACDVVATPNPGCMMQIGGGLRLEGAPEGVVHPVELLDESYRRAGFYGRRRT